MSKQAMGFYELQDIRVRCWDAQQDGKAGEPLFTPAQMLEILDEVERLRHLTLDIQKLVGDATPEHTTAAPSPSEVNDG